MELLSFRQSDSGKSSMTYGKYALPAEMLVVFSPSLANQDKQMYTQQYEYFTQRSLETKPEQCRVETGFISNYSSETGFCQVLEREFQGYLLLAPLRGGVPQTKMREVNSPAGWGGYL
jgi:hypothetical protein